MVNFQITELLILLIMILAQLKIEHLHILTVEIKT